MSTAVAPEVVETPATDTLLSAPAPDTVLEPAAVVEPVTPVAPAVPETYDLTLPENAALDAASLERTVAHARERGLSNEAAKAALDLANTEVGLATAALLAAHQPGGAAWTKEVEAWKTETMADPALGKTPEERTAAIQKGVSIVGKYTTAHPDQAESFKGFLDATGIGNHPAAVKFFAWLGEAASEGSLVTSQIGGESRRTTQDVFYGPK